MFQLYALLLLLPTLTRANISGYGEAPAAEAPAATAPAAAAAAPATADCGDIESTSEAKANGPNPFCVYPALVGDHPSSGKRPGPTHEISIPPGVQEPSEPSDAASESAAPAAESAPAPSAAAAQSPAAAAAPASSPYSKSARFRAFQQRRI